MYHSCEDVSVARYAARDTSSCIGTDGQDSDEECTLLEVDLTGNTCKQGNRCVLGCCVSTAARGAGNLLYN